MYSQYPSTFLNKPSSTAQYYRSNPSIQYRSIDQSIRPTFSPTNQRQSKFPNFAQYTPSSLQRPKIKSLSPGHDQPYTRTYTNPSYQGIYKIHSSTPSKQGYSTDIGYSRVPMEMGQRMPDPNRFEANYVSSSYASSKPVHITPIRHQNQTSLNRYAKYNYSTTPRDQSMYSGNMSPYSIESNLGYKQMRVQKQPYSRGYGQSTYGNRREIVSGDIKYKNSGYGFGSGGYGGLNSYQRLDRGSGFKQNYNHLKY